MKDTKVKSDSKKMFGEFIETPASKNFPFKKINFILMGVGLVVIALGYLLMSGGGTDDPNVFPAEEIYSFRRITLAPAVVLIGYLIEVVAIFYAFWIPKKDSNEA